MTGHGHGHHRHFATENRGLVAALTLTSVVLAVEVVGGLWSGSLALLSDAGHMLTDASALALSLLALRFAARPADERRTYGYYRLEILAALANGVALVLIAVVIAWEASERLFERPPVDTPLMIGVAAVGLLANLGGLFFLSRGLGSLNVRGAFLHVLSDTLSSVAVLIGGVAMYFTGYYLIDPILSFVIVLVVVYSAWRLVRESVDVLLEAVPSHLDQPEVARTIEAIDGVSAVHDLHIWTITSGMYALSAHVVVDTEHTHENDAILACIKEVVRKRFHVDHTTIQIEGADYEHAHDAVC